MTGKRRTQKPCCPDERQRADSVKNKPLNIPLDFDLAVEELLNTPPKYKKPQKPKQD